MNIQDLYYFHRFAQEHSFTKVAGYFKVSQPTITLAVKRLEHEFGTKLVERHTAHNELCMTSCGVQLHNHIQLMLKEWQLAHLEIDALKQQMIRFGMSPAISSYLFPQITDELLQIDLLRQLHMYEAGSREVLRAIIDGKVDIGLIGCTAPPDSEQLVCERLFAVPFKIIAAPTHPLAARPAVSFREAAAFPFVVLDHRFANSLAIEQLVRRTGIRPEVICRISNIGTLKRIVSRGSAISCLADLSVLPGDPVACLPLRDEKQPQLIIMLIYRKTLNLSAHANHFMAIIRRLKAAEDNPDVVN